MVWSRILPGLRVVSFPVSLPEIKETQMTLLTLSIVAISFAPPQAGCLLPPGSLSERRVFTNADLERMAACRYQTGAQSEVGTDPAERSSRSPRSGAKVSAPEHAGGSAIEADWRAQWRSIDQKTRRLRREARELRQEAGEAPKGPKKPSGRRSPSLLISRAGSLEAEAKDLEDEFQERARREGALPGWLRPKAR